MLLRFVIFSFCCMLTLSACRETDVLNPLPAPSCEAANAKITVAVRRQVGRPAVRTHISGIFTSTTLDVAASWQRQEVGTLLVADRTVPFYYNLSNTYDIRPYTDSAIIHGKVTASLTGASDGYTDFVHETTKAQPTVADYQLSKDTIVATQPFTITFGEVTSVDSITLILGANQGIQYTFPANVPSYTVTTADIAAARAGNFVYFLVVGFNRSTLEQRGKEICFELRDEIEHAVVIIP